MGRFRALAVFMMFFLMVSVSWATQAPSLLAKPPAPMAPADLIRSFEDLLGRQAGLLHSFEMLVGKFELPPVELLRSFEDLLYQQAKLLQSYESLARLYACTPGQRPEPDLVASFEKLLHGQAKLLRSFEALIHRHRLPPLELVASFERLLKGQTELLHSFEGMLHCLVEVHRLPPRALYGFTVSFEKLLRSQAELLQSFEALLGGKPSVEQQEPPMHMPSMPPYGFPEEPMLPSLDDLKDFALWGKELLQSGRLREFFPALADLSERFSTKLKNFKQAIQTMRAHGHGEGAERLAAKLAEFRGNLIRLQSELLKQSLTVEMMGMAEAPALFRVTVENRGPFTVELATLLLFEGKRLIYTQSLGTLEPGARRTLTVRVDAMSPMEVRAMATGFIALITKLLAASTIEN